MSKLYRKPQNKAASAGAFRQGASKTKALNLMGLQRGGWRL